MRRPRVWLALLLLAVVALSCSSPATPTTAPPRPTRTPPPPTEVPPPQSSGARYYVDSRTGSDANPGASPGRPWRTLDRVERQALQPGDVVSLACGSSWDGGLVISQSGASGRPITFQPYGSGDAPTLRNPGTRTKVITIEGSWVVVKGLLVRDAHEYGVQIVESAANNVVQDCEASAVGTGFAVFGHDNLIQGCYVHDLAMIVDTPGGDDDYGAVGVGIFGSYNEIAYNRLERCLASSHDYGSDGGAFELYGDVTGNYIHHNWAADNRGFLEVGGGQAQDNVLAYNVSLNNGTFSVIHLDGRFASAVTHLYVDNNTIVETGAGSILLDFAGEPTPDTLFLRNNVVYVGSYRQVADSAAFTHTNNLYFLKQRQTRLGFGLGPGEQTGDPLFVDLDAQDFRLQPESPAAGGGAELRYEDSFPTPPTPDGSSFHVGALPAVDS